MAGHAGASATNKCRLKHLFHSYSIIHASDHLKRRKDSKPSRTRMMTWMAVKLDLPLNMALQSQTSNLRLELHLKVLSNTNSAGNYTHGCFLIATMTSFRFRDLLRSKPESLSIPGHILRGISWRTRTSVSGHPWRVCCIGCATRPSTGHWVFRFLEALQIGIDKSREHWGSNWSPNFLLPSWTDSIPFSSPCSYHHALALIRFSCQCNWLSPALLTPEQASNLSTHSLKSTLLAAAGQLNLNLESRAKQGHHKESVQLFSREDVWPSLFLQRDILIDISGRDGNLLNPKHVVPSNHSRNHEFGSPPIAPEDLKLVQMLQRKSSPASPAGSNKNASPTPVEDSDAQGEDDSSSSSSSDSSNHQMRRVRLPQHHPSWG